MEINKVELKDMHPSINQVLPTEMLKKILDNLDVKSLCFSKQTCKHWKDIIDEFELVKKASGKSVET